MNIQFKYFKSKKFFDLLSRGLLQARIQTGAKEYLNMMLLSALSAFFSVWFIASLYFDDLFIGFGLGIFLALIVLSSFIIYPLQRKKTSSKLFEKELPFALLQANMELNLNLPFEDVLKHLTNEYGLFSDELKRVIKNISIGNSVQDSLFDLSRRFDSLLVKRAVSQIINVYEQGNKKDALKKLAEEILERQKIEVKEFSSRMIMLSLLFIAASAIIPALFQAYLVVGSMILDLGLTPTQTLLIPIVVFPLADLGILMFIKMKTPYVLRQ